MRRRRGSQQNLSRSGDGFATVEAGAPVALAPASLTLSRCPFAVPTCQRSPVR